MVLRLFVILSSAEAQDEIRVKEKLKKIDHRFSCSPSRFSPYSTGVDFFATLDATKEEVMAINSQLTDYYQGDYNSWDAKSFNATLFDEAIDSLQLEYFD